MFAIVSVKIMMYVNFVIKFVTVRKRCSFRYEYCYVIWNTALLSFRSCMNAFQK